MQIVDSLQHLRVRVRRRLGERVVNPSATSAQGVNRSASGVAKLILQTIQDQRESDLRRSGAGISPPSQETEGGDVPAVA